MSTVLLLICFVVGMGIGLTIARPIYGQFDTSEPLRRVDTHCPWCERHTGTTPALAHTEDELTDLILRGLSMCDPDIVANYFGPSGPSRQKPGGGEA
jgi:hypothetical protein